MTGVLFLAAVTLSAAAQEIPRINPDGVIANGPGPRAPLTPGMEISIYGQHLGPEAGCTARARELHELCGTVVTVGGISADLLYVQEKQINVRAPFNMPSKEWFRSSLPARASPVRPSRPSLGPTM